MDEEKMQIQEGKALSALNESSQTKYYVINR